MDDGRPAVVPPPLRHHPARPRLAQPRGRRDVRERAAVLARPGRRRLPGRRRPRPVQGGEPARPARDADRRPLGRHGRAQPRDDEPMWDQPEVHEIYRQWRKVLDSYDGDRMAVAEAWTQTTDSMARFVRPDELSQTFNFGVAARRLVGPRLRRRHPRHARRDAAVRLGADVGAEQPRRGPPPDAGTAAAPRGLARARAATLTMLALPGSAYLYQGEELGLEEVDVSPEALAGPGLAAHRREGPRRLPGPDPVGRAPRRRTASAPVRASRGSRSPTTGPALSVEAQWGRAGSTLEFYREALRCRREHTLGLGDDVRLARGPARRADVPPWRADGRAQLRRDSGRAARRRGAGHAAARSTTARCPPTPPSGCADAGSGSTPASRARRGRVVAPSCVGEGRQVAGRDHSPSRSSRRSRRCA